MGGLLFSLLQFSVKCDILCTVKAIAIYKKGADNMLMVLIKGDNYFTTDGAPEIVADLPADADSIKSMLADKIAESGEIPKNWREKEEYGSEYLDGLKFHIEKIGRCEFYIQFGKISDDLECLVNVCKDIQEMSGFEKRRLAAFIISNYGIDYVWKHRLTALMMEEAIEKAGHKAFYDGMTVEEAAREMADNGDFGTIPDELYNYIDFSAFGNDLIACGDFCDTVYGAIRK